MRSPRSFRGLSQPEAGSALNLRRPIISVQDRASPANAERTTPAHFARFGSLINKSCLLQTSICCIFRRNNLKSAGRMIKNISISTTGLVSFATMVISFATIVLISVL